MAGFDSVRKFVDEMPSEIIGALVAGHVVVCRECIPIAMSRYGLNEFANLYAVNIGSYKQTCHCCGTIVKKGYNEHWPELFSPMLDTTPNVEHRLIG